MLLEQQRTKAGLFLQCDNVSSWRKHELWSRQGLWEDFEILAVEAVDSYC